MISVVKGGLTSVSGFRAAGVESGIKPHGKDLLLLVSERGPIPAAGLFTSNLIKSASLQVTKEHLEDPKLGAVVANGGCANTFTGEQGLRDAREMARIAGGFLDFRPKDIGVASTGLIGSRLPLDNIRKGIKNATNELSNSWEAGTNAAKAIMTTDTSVKEVAVEVEADTRITIGGAAKGAGMVHPDLHATMLTFIVTDALITPAALRTALQKSADISFNMLSIDRDRSPNDMVLAMANGLAKNERITESNQSEEFQSGLNRVTNELAQMIASDGEGAEHLLEVHVNGAKSEGDARQAARSIVGSNLVKAAIFGGDPNWGRIITALGYSGIAFDPSRIALSLKSEKGEASIVQPGEIVVDEELSQATNVLKGEKIEIIIDLRIGNRSATAWGCDLTPDYVKINSYYTT